ncbi:MAG TPA: phage holin family protein [Actinomycetes bacterium]|nr:phage holin family protein [Actinomycetes bacterium]
MQSILVRIIVNAIALGVAAWIVDGVDLTSDSTANQVFTLLAVAAIFGLVNTFIKPIVQLISLPFIVLTLGLLIFVINALLLWLTGAISSWIGLSFSVEGFWPALLASLIISLVSFAMNMVIPDNK